MGTKKYFEISFPDIEKLVLKAIVYYKKNNSYSEQWLRLQLKELSLFRSGAKGEKK